MYLNFRVTFPNILIKLSTNITTFLKNVIDMFEKNKNFLKIRPFEICISNFVMWSSIYIDLE